MKDVNQNTLTDNSQNLPSYARYASSANQKFLTNIDEIQSLYERFDNYIANDEGTLETIKTLCAEFRERFPEYKTFHDMYPDMVEIPNNRVITFRDLFINCSFQRIPSRPWVISIVGKFDPFYLNALRTYVHNKKKNQYAIWDGQHTALSLLCIALYAFDLSLEEISKLKVPANVYPGKDLAKLRRRFIGMHDDTMSKPLDKIDLYQQYVWGVRNNGDTDPWALRFEQIQQSAEKHQLFITHPKFEDDHHAGAVTRLSEIYPNGRDVTKWKAKVIDNVFEYHAITNPESPVEPLEIDNMAHIFRACDQQQITVDTDYIKAFAKCLGMVTANTWKSGHNRSGQTRKHAMVVAAYKSWLNRQPQQIRDNYSERCNQTEVAPTWLCQAVANTGAFPYDLPEFLGKYRYDFDAKELS